jgi:hypothetical protein
MFDGIPGTVGGETATMWAQRAGQVLDVIIQRFGSRGDPGVADPPPRDLRVPDARLRRVCRLLSRRNAVVAAALGACRCWGLSEGCPRCHGEGRPGTFEVDPVAFAEVVVPLIVAQPELIAWHVARAMQPHRATDSQPEPGNTIVNP